MSWKERARRFRDDAHALFLAGRDPRTPRTAKILIAGFVAYALSPIDLIPDFVPIVGHLDGLVLVPLGIALAVRMIPAEVLADAWEKAKRVEVGGGRGRWVAAVLVVFTWLVLGLIILRLLALSDLF